MEALSCESLFKNSKGSICGKMRNSSMTGKASRRDCRKETKKPVRIFCTSPLPQHCAAKEERPAEEF